MAVTDCTLDIELGNCFRESQRRNLLVEITGNDHEMDVAGCRMEKGWRVVLITAAFERSKGEAPSVLEAFQEALNGEPA